MTNVIVFGLSENKDETVEEKVQEQFQEIGLKPSLQACRVCRISIRKSKRLLKVSLSSSSTAHQVLSQAPNLRHNSAACM
jgi:hypothetical protein